MNLTPRIDKIDTNYIINGNFDNWQRGTSHTAAGYGSADRFIIKNTFSGVTTMSQSSDVPNNNSLYSLNYQITTPSAISSTDWIGATHTFEGSLTRALANKNISLGFWFKSSHVGKHSGFFIRANNVRRYIFEFDYDVADTWQYFIINLNLDLQTFVYNNLANFYLGFNMAVGSTYQRASGTWANSSEFGVTGGLDLSNISGAYIRLSQLQLVENTGQILDGSSFSYAGGDVTKDFQLCQRYYEKSYLQSIAPSTITDTGKKGFNVGVSTTSNFALQLFFMTLKRAVPSITTYSSVTGASGKGDRNGTDTNAIPFAATEHGCLISDTGTNSAFSYWYHYTVDAEL